MIILFVDFDYFFAQVEEVLNPQYKGKPLIVCVYSGRDKTSGAVATANYEARRLGIKAGMPIKRALEIAPNAIYLPMRKEVYAEVSDRIMKILRNYAEKMEVASIDEAYLDITSKVSNFDEAYSLAKEIKEEILSKEKITVTIGIAPNKVLAKIIADRSKPNGIGIVKPEEIEEFMKTIKIDEVPGIGEVLSKKLEEEGIKTLVDVINFPFSKLEELIGRAKANYLVKLVTNQYNEPVIERERKPHGRYLTLPYNTRDVEVVFPHLKRAIDEAYDKVKGIPMRITVVAILEDLEIKSKGKKFKHGISKERAYLEAYKLLKELISEDRRKVRRIGVRLDDIITGKGLDSFF
jgi:DNA polymerase IV (DinB-like DNA polymerase)